MEAAGPLVSIVITNFNYAAFVGAAIESALSQTHPAVEIIVVDDGSTDASRSVIASFGDRIAAVFKENGGQTSCINAGYETARGEIVLFLDSDDMLQRHAVAEIVAAMRPGVAAVQFCLATIDGDGAALGGILPPLPADWTPERILATVLSAGFYPYPPTSGNAYGRWFLEKLMPLPAGHGAEGVVVDGALNAVAPLHGDVVVLKEPLGLYRIHGKNRGALDTLAPERFSFYVALDRARGAFLMDEARKLGVALPKDVLDRAFYYLQYRLASLKLRPDLHPLAEDSIPRLAFLLARAAMIAPDRALLRAFVAIWGAAVALAPGPLARRLVAMRFISEARPKLLDKALSWLALVRRSQSGVARGREGVTR
jgi:glycosyltransferase involved in cell wall biosynthesis